MTPALTKQLRAKLLQWYRKHKRDLPWRRSRDPYAIWVSEIMLQQTQVVTVIPYYERFLKRFPNLRALAEAPEEEVLAHWAGLGYYRRAKLLQRGAQAVLQNYGGKIPDQAESLEELPGIGAYTAGAIASIAFGRAAPLVDGNVVRVLSRVFERRGHAKDAQLHREIWDLARDLVDPKDPGDFNQGLMELGATLCRVALPSCGRCPLQTLCGAALRGNPEDYPETPPAQKTLRLQRAAVVAQREDAILLIKPKQSRWFQGLWTLPHEFVGEDGAEQALGEWLSRTLGLGLTRLKALPTTHHSITHHRISTQAWLGQATGRLKLKTDFGEARFFPRGEMHRTAMPSFDQKVLRAAKII